MRPSLREDGGIHKGALVGRRHGRLHLHPRERDTTPFWQSLSSSSLLWRRPPYIKLMPTAISLHDDLLSMIFTRSV